MRPGLHFSAATLSRQLEAMGGASCRPRNVGSCRCSMPGDAMEDVIFQYDGSFPGFLCCVFDSYAHKRIPHRLLQR